MQLPELESVLDEESFEWLSVNYPPIARAVDTSIKAGATPADVKLFVLGHTGREELALRCQQAAAHLIRTKKVIQ
jgi:hypothetical protein